MSEILRWMIYLYTGLAAAAFAYGVIQMFFLTRYADYQERMLRSFGERGGGLALVIDPQKLQHLSILLARRLARISEQLPTGLELLVNSMRAGLTLGVALERNLERMPPDLREELSVVLHEFRLGTSLSDALLHWSMRIGLQDVRLVASAAVLSLRCGGSLADAFQTLGGIIRQRADFNKEVKALTAEGRFQALLMTALPFVIMIIMTLVNHATMMEFFENPIGKGLLLTMVGMQIAAFFWIRKLVSFDL